MRLGGPLEPLARRPRLCPASLLHQQCSPPLPFKPAAAGAAGACSPAARTIAPQAPLSAAASVRLRQSGVWLKLLAVWMCATMVAMPLEEQEAASHPTWRAERLAVSGTFSGGSPAALLPLMKPQPACRCAAQGPLSWLASGLPPCQADMAWRVGRAPAAAQVQVRMVAELNSAPRDLTFCAWRAGAAFHSRMPLSPLLASMPQFGTEAQPELYPAAEAVSRTSGVAAERIMHSGGTLGGGDMGQSGMGAEPVQRTDLDLTR